MNMRPSTQSGERPVARVSRIVRSRQARLQRLPLQLAVRYGDAERPRRTPRLVQIEATSRCNLRCPSCSHSREKAAGRHLTTIDLRRVLDRLPAGVKRVRLSGVGEPLLNPEFPTLVDTLAARGIECDFITNGTLLTPSVREALLSRPNIVGVSVSCDGASASTFEACRAGANFERWRQLVGDFLAEAALRPDPPVAISSTVATTENISELPDVVRMVAGLGFDEATILEPIPVDDEARKLCPSPDQLAALRGLGLEELGASLGLRVTLALSRNRRPRQDRRVACMQPWEYMLVHESGDVAPCCALFGTDVASVVGNIFRQSFHDIWYGEAFREFRRTSAVGTNVLCQKCPYY